MDGFAHRGIGRGVIKRFIKQVNDEKKTVVVSSPKSVTVEKEIKFAPKPEPGNAGQAVKLKTNFFKMRISLSNLLIIHHYDVVIERSFNKEEDVAAAAPIIASSRRVKKLEKSLNRVVFDQMVEQRSGFGELFHNIVPVYDGDKNLFLDKELAEDADEAMINEYGLVRYAIEAMVKESNDEDEEKKFIVRLKNVGLMKIDPNARFFTQDALQFLDIAMRYGITKNKIVIGNKIFAPSPLNRHPISTHKELAFGFLQSARNHEAGLLLNVDRAASLFHKGGNLVEVFRSVIQGIDRMMAISPKHVRQMTEELRGMKVKLIHLRFPIKYRVMEFSQQSAENLFFTYQDKDAAGNVIAETKMSVADYFEKEYSKLKHPNWPCLVVGTKTKRYFPLEVCNLIPDQYVSKKTSGIVTAEMTRLSTRQSPNERFRMIDETLKKSLVDGEVYLQEFGIEVSPDLLEVTGRILRPPDLKYGDPLPLTPERTGSWSMTRPARQFERPIHLKRWVLVEITMSVESVCGESFRSTFPKLLRESAIRNGMNIDRPEKIFQFKFDADRLRKFMETAKKNVPDLQLIVFMIPKDDKVYATIKTLGDTVFGIPTQCVSLINYHASDPKKNKLSAPSYLSNVILKMNTKLGGVNTALNVNWSETKKIMFVGIDVTHPSPGDRLPLSIASCVASYDNSFAKYASKQCVQKETSSDIVHLDSQISFLLAKYRDENGGLNPNCVVVYRDGVSEGQFDQVSKVEIAKLKKALMQLDSNAKLTYIVVQKRHNTRFIPTERGNANNNGNALPGTVVDKDIIDSQFFNFFLCSHNGQLGTSRSAHYYVLYDENNLSSNLVQRITYNLCYTLGRCTQPISVAAPVYFAHLSAYRSRHYITEAISSSSSSEYVGSGSSSNRTTAGFMEQMNTALKIHENLNTRMYYI